MANYQAVIAAIKKLQIRGAPLIGIAAAFSIALEALQGRPRNQLLVIAEELRAARPTAVNLMFCVDRMKSAISASANVDAGKLLILALKIFDEDQELCRQIALRGESLIQDGEDVLTHCNTGGLATAGVGTALGIIKQAHDSGKHIKVWVDETRPLLQGGRLTTWELAKYGIPHTLITDSMAASLMKSKRVQKVLVGADRIAINGDFANKIGTYNLAVLCHHHQIPLIVAAPYTTIDFELKDGSGIEIENRNPAEVRSSWAPPTVEVLNPAFDVTPAELTSYWVFDRAVLNRSAVREGAIESLKF